MSTGGYQFGEAIVERVVIGLQVVAWLVFVLAIAHNWQHSSTQMRFSYILTGLIFPLLWLRQVQEKSSLYCRWLATFAFIVASLERFSP
jgi:hypothetical protein